MCSILSNFWSRESGVKNPTSIQASQRRVLLIALMMLVSVMGSVVQAENFWGRYSKKPAKEFRDSVWEAKQEALESKKVRFIYDVDFMTYFDNREYYEPYQIPQTIFNTRLSPTVGVRVRDHVGGKHDFVGSVRYTQRMGGDWKDVQFDPTIYYRWRYKGFDLSMGAIPFENRVRPLQDWLLYDSVAYMHPNIQGALLQYHDERGYVSAMADWRGAQTATRREMFRVIIDGEYHWKGLMVGGLAQLNHTAGTAENDTLPLYDDLNLSVNIGFDATQYVPLDSLSLRAGYIYGFARDRQHAVTYQPQGLYVELYVNWWFLGLKNTFYYGDNLQPFRHDIGALMCQGDPFYQSRLYNRLDLFAYLYRSSFVDFYFSYNFHFDNRQIQEQQQLIVRFNLDGLLSRRSGYIHALFDK